MRRAALFALLLLAACTDDGPRLSNLRCTPNSVSAAPPGPYAVQCTVDYTGSVGDVLWVAANGGTMWTSGTSVIDDGDTLRFMPSSATAPLVGPLEIRVDVEHPDGIDGPAGDSISTTITVTP